MSDNLYSQNDEETFIVNFFKGFVGRFLDIGAYDGKSFSNTRKLCELGWRGVLVEPSPTVFPHLRTNCEEFGDNVDLHQVAIANHDGKIRFFDSGGDAISTTEQAHVDKWVAGYSCKYTEVEAECLLLETFLGIVGRDFHFIKIDTESTNFKLLQQLKLRELHHLRMVCIEHDSRIDEMLEIFNDAGFEQLTWNGENLIVVKK